MFRKSPALLGDMHLSQGYRVPISWLVGHCAELDAAGIDPRTIRDDAVRDRDALTAKAERMAELWLNSLPSRLGGTE